MPWGIERLRAAIVALAMLLLVGIVGSFLYGRWRLRRLAQDLPARLGLEVQQTTEGFVLSESNREGRTLFTLRAARAVKFKQGGRVSLHDVKIEVFNGRENGPDTIAGKDFEYDPRSQVVESKGEAHMVLQAPAQDGEKSAVPVEVATHDLIFSQKTGVASSSGEVDFATGDSSGQAMGAEYDSKQGHLLLQSAVVLRTVMQGAPAVLRASRGVYDRGRQQVELWQPRYESAGESAAARQATMELRPGGIAERLDAQGDVRLKTAAGMEVRAPAMQVMLNESRRPRMAEFPAGARFAFSRPGETMTGEAGRANLAFDARGDAERAVLDGAVQLAEQASAGGGEVRRTLAAGHVVLHMAPVKGGPMELQSAEASGNAMLRSDTAEPAQASRATTLAGENLRADFVPGNQVRELHGSGHTRLETVAANGDVDTSAGDTLVAEFFPANGGARASTLLSAVQTGHVVLRQIAGSAERGVSTATAQMATYTAAEDRMVLTGRPVLRNAQMEMAAARMEWRRTGGELAAQGDVRATLLAESRGSAGVQPGSPFGGREPAHVIAERAVIRHDRGMAVFLGHARLWQGSDSVEAPVIEISNASRTLAAYAESGCTQCVVSVFSSATPVSTPIGSRAAAHGAPAVFRILSSRLLYSDPERTAEFAGPVRLTGADSQLTAETAKVSLAPAQPRRAASTAGNAPVAGRAGGEQPAVETIVAGGDVRLEQPGRSAAGTRLEYTAGDGHFVLTGEPGRLPRIVDADRGTVTGPVLTFAAREQAIMVSGAAGQSTTTKTRVRKK